jgi:hypothetical protein
MAISDKLTFRVVNDLLHDLTAGVVPGAVLALWMVRNGAKAVVTPVELASMVESWSWIVGLLFAAVVVFVVTGSVRISYRTRNLSEAGLQAQGRSALVKHAFFIAVFVYAAVVAFSVIQP